MRSLNRITLIIILLCYYGGIYAQSIDNAVLTEEYQNLLEQDAKTRELLKVLIERGVLSKAEVNNILKKAEEQARAKTGPVTEVVPESEKDIKSSESNVVRVPYIPSYIKDEIKNQVSQGLREDVTNDVLSKAKNERWGVPYAWPAWLKHIKISGDLRVRAQFDNYADDNSDQIPDILALNNGAALNTQDIFINSTEDRNRMRGRLRLGVKAKVTEGVTFAARLAGGNEKDPVSSNQTYSGNFSTSGLSVDRAYIKLNTPTKNWNFWAGRMPNPWFSTDLIWDKDLNFEGLALQNWWRRSDDIFAEEKQFDPFFTLGVFPLEEVELSSDDKWLWGAQAGLEYTSLNQNKLKLALAYYDYKNIDGQRNVFPGSTLTNFTAPATLQKGNNVFNIVNSPTNDKFLFALASDFDIASLTVEYDYILKAPIHFITTFEYAENLAYDAKDLFRRVGANADGFVLFANNTGQQILTQFTEENTAYLLSMAFGWQKVSKKKDWQVKLTYKYLEKDAVLDAFTDSDFNLGGTDAEGIILQFTYGLAQDLVLSTKLLSSNEVQGFDARGYAVDIFQIDLSTQF